MSEESDGGVSPTRPVLTYAVPSTEPPKWVRLAPFGAGVEAQLAVSALHAKGITARLLNENAAVAHSLVFQASIEVPAAQADEARAVLRDVEDRAARRRSANRCPRCNVECGKGPSRWRRRVGWTLVVIGVLFTFAWPIAMVLVPIGVGTAVFATSDRLRCPKCDAILPEAEDDEDDDEDEEDERDTDRHADTANDDGPAVP